MQFVCQKCINFISLCFI